MSDSGWSHYIARLKDWPYASRQLLQTPISELIDGHAIALISRALNIGRVTAFVGSGASMAYGRIGWTDMIKTVQERALRRHEEEKDKLKFHPAIMVRAERLKDLLTFQSIDKNARVDVNQQLTVFQLAEELHRELDRTKGPSPSSFRDDIMWLTHDDRAHIEQILIAAFRHRGRPDERLMNPNPKTGKHQAVDEAELRKLVQQCLWGSGPPPEYDRYLPWLDIKPGDPFYGLFRPLQRHAVAARLAAMPEKERMQSLEQLGDALAKSRTPAHERRPGFKLRLPRQRMISAHQDPLAVVIETLKINRFLTTNYDREIELALEDRGMWFAPVEARGVHSARSSQLDPLSHSYHDVVFTHEHHGELAALASRDRVDTAWVVHLHGRSEEGSSTGIVATERDYQERYERDHGTRDQINASTNIALGASPILFLGVGMDEMDLLRPLRQFMSSPRRIGDRIAVALLPIFYDEKKAQLRQIQLLQQYGVYALHYGNRFSVKATGSGSGTSEFGGSAWLHRIDALKSKLVDVLVATDDIDLMDAPSSGAPGKAKIRRGRQVIDGVDQTVNALELFLKQNGNAEALGLLANPTGALIDGHRLSDEMALSLREAAKAFATALTGC